jgi:hypothetical protein
VTCPALHRFFPFPWLDESSETLFDQPRQLLPMTGSTEETALSGLTRVRLTRIDKVL